MIVFCFQFPVYFALHVLCILSILAAMFKGNGTPARQGRMYGEYCTSLCSVPLAVFPALSFSDQTSRATNSSLPAFIKHGFSHLTNSSRLLRNACNIGDRIFLTIPSIQPLLNPPQQEHEIQAPKPVPILFPPHSSHSSHGAFRPPAALPLPSIGGSSRVPGLEPCFVRGLSRSYLSRIRISTLIKFRLRCEAIYCTLHRNIGDVI